jgi:hypothetical protein
MMGRGNEMRGIGCYSKPCFRKFKATVTTGVSTAVAGECDSGISAGTFSSGAVVFTFAPKPRKVSLIAGGTIESAADRLRAAPTSAYDVAAGTLAVNFRADDDGADEGPSDGQSYEVFFLTEEGSS